MDSAETSRPRPQPAARAVSLPHNRDVERSVLATLLGGTVATAIHTIRALVGHPLMYFERDHRFIYQASLELDDQGQRVDSQAVAEYLSRYRFQAMVDRIREQEIALEREELDGLGRERWRDRFRRGAGDEAASIEDSALAAIGGTATVYDIATAFAASGGLQRNTELLRDYHLKRRFITQLTRLTDHAVLTTDSFGKMIDSAGSAVLQLARQETSMTVQGIEDVWKDTIDHIQERMTNRMPGILTGMEDIDRKMISLRPGGLYIFAARPGVGKTSLALKIAGNIAGHPGTPHGVLFFSLEVANMDLLKKLLCAEGRLDFAKLDRCELGQDEMELLMETASRIKRWPFDMVDIADLTASKLRSLVKRRQLEHPERTRIVFIDYLQLLQGSRADMSEYEKISEITRGLKLMAREMGVPVVALSQLSRNSESGTAPREPRLSDLRGSGSIEQDADAVLFIHREGGDDHARRIKLLLEKNRFGPTGQSWLMFHPANMRFEQIAAPNQEESPDAQEAEPQGQSPARARDLF